MKARPTPTSSATPNACSPSGAGSPTELDADLVTLGETDFDGGLVNLMTAHPKLDPDTGRLCFFGAGPATPYLHYYELGATGAMAHHAPIDLPARGGPCRQLV